MLGSTSLRSMHYGADHCDISVRSISAAFETYTKLGFTVFTPSPYDGMPIASAQIVFPGFYVAATGFTEAFETGILKLPTPFQPRARRHGISYISLGAKDSAACAAAFREAGFIAAEPFEAHRIVDVDNVDRKVGFKISMLPQPVVRDTPIDFITQHLTPDLIWRQNQKPHANGAQKVTRLVALHPDPGGLKKEFAAVIGETTTNSAGDVEVNAGSMLILITTPERFGAVLPGLTPQTFHAESPPCRFAAIEFASADLARTSAFLAAAKTPTIAATGRISVLASSAENVALSFVQS